MLDEGQQLLPTALLGQDLEDVGEAWTEEEQVEGVRVGRLVPGKRQARIWYLFFTIASAKRAQHPSLTWQRPPSLGDT